MVILTGLEEGLIQHQVNVIADGSYGAMYAVMPTDQSNRNWRAKHAALRSVIERVNSRTASFTALCINTGKFRGPPELQAAALMCIYHLVQHSFENAPLYANGSGPARWHWSHTSFVDPDTNISNSDYETFEHSNGSGSDNDGGTDGGLRGDPDEDSGVGGSDAVEDAGGLLDG